MNPQWISAISADKLDINSRRWFPVTESVPSLILSQSGEKSFAPQKKCNKDSIIPNLVSSSFHRKVPSWVIKIKRKTLVFDLPLFSASPPSDHRPWSIHDLVAANHRFGQAPTWPYLSFSTGIEPWRYTGPQKRKVDEEILSSWKMMEMCPSKLLVFSYWSFVGLPKLAGFSNQFRRIFN